MLVGNQTTAARPNWPNSANRLKAQARGIGGKKTQAVLNQIKKRYGDAELQRAIREFNLTFKGIQRDPEEGKNPRHG